VVDRVAAMKICLVTLGFAPYRASGLSVYGEQVAIGLAHRGHSVTVLAGQRGHPQANDGVALPSNLSIEFLPVGRLDWIGLGWQAAKRLKKQKFDIVHFLDLHFAYKFNSSFIASVFQLFEQRMTGRRGKPYYTFRYEAFLKIAYYKIIGLSAERLSAINAKKIAASSWTTFREFMVNYKNLSNKLTMIYPGIDVRSYQLRVSRADARQRLGLDPSWFVLLFVGFGGPRKGLEIVPAVMHRMPKSVHFFAIGRWNEHYMRKFLNNLETSIRDRVHLLGYVDEVKKRLFYIASDVFIFPTWLEGFGLPLAEAMAAGLPIVTTANGAAAEVVSSFGALAKPGCVEDYCTAIQNLLSSPDQRNYISERSRQRAVQVFDRDLMASNLEALYLN